jgi:hypothetical protein
MTERVCDTIVDVPNREGPVSAVQPHQAAWDRLDSIADTEERWLDGQAAYLRTLMVGEDDRLGRIGSGVQYVVYALPGNKVFKVPQTRMSARNENIRQGGDEIDTEKILRRREEGADYVRKLVSEHPEAARLFGDPVFNGERGTAGAFEQDRLTFLGGDGFNALSSSEQLDYIHKFIDVIKSMWTYGCSDRTMNFQVNTGADSEGNVVLADFGEMYLTKLGIVKMIQERRWSHAWGMSVLSEEVRSAANLMFTSELTEANLEDLWAQRLQ